MAVIRLSRKAWNNVLIFSMLIMIFLFNGLHHKLNPAAEPEGPQPVLPAQSFVLVMELPGVKLERIGTGWRTTGESLAVAPDGLVAAWQGAEANLLLGVDELKALAGAAPLTAASFWLAGEEKARVYQLYANGGAYALFDKQDKRWLRFDAELAKQLFPFSL